MEHMHPTKKMNPANIPLLEVTLGIGLVELAGLIIVVVACFWDTAFPTTNFSQKNSAKQTTHEYCTQRVNQRFPGHDGLTTSVKNSLSVHAEHSNADVFSASGKPEEA